MDAYSTSNGYYTISNHSSGLLIDLYQGSLSAGTFLDETALTGAATQSQQWLLRPVFFRGIDNALLEKQGAERASTGLIWWKNLEEAARMFFAMLKKRARVKHEFGCDQYRPADSIPRRAGCTGNACTAETDSQDLDLAKRSRNLGLSLELTLLFDGGSSASVPDPGRATPRDQLQTDIYNYVKTEIMAYRQAGTMPDLVAIGNEVDTGFLGPIGSPTGANFGGFAALQIQAMQAVEDAAADTSIGPAIPPPLTCIHVTPAWDLTQFFTLVNQNNIPYDAICQSYYPIFHGPLTDAQAAASNPGDKPVRADILTTAASLGKPIFIIETGEHYENGFQANDPWYSPPSTTMQTQFLLDLQTVLQGLPNDLGMGFEYSGSRRSRHSELERRLFQRRQSPRRHLHLEWAGVV